MITEDETADYRRLCATVNALREKFLRRKEELRLLLEETAALRRDTLLVLAKANRLTRHLTGGQRQIAGLTYHLSEINARIERINRSMPLLFQSPGAPDGEKSHNDGVLLPEIGDLVSRDCMSGDCMSLENCRSRRELKQREIAIIKMIDSVKGKLLQLDLLEFRCRELMVSIKKALQAFRHESGIISRKIYPFGVFSRLHRAFRKIRGASYFSFRDMGDIGALAAITAAVLRIADSPAI